MSEKIANLAPNRDQLELFQRLAPEGADVKWVDSTQSIEDQAKELDGVTAVIVTPSEYSVDLARLTPSVRLVQTVSAGTNMIDKQALGELGITVSNNGGGNAISVAEHTMGLLVSTVRKLQLQFNSVQAGRCDLLVLHGSDQGSFIDYGATAGVDQNRRGLHHIELGVADHVECAGV